MKVAGKVVVVTGGGNGMGREVVVELLRRGARVAAVDIRQDGLDQTASLVNAGDRLATFQVDITDRAAVEALPGRVEDALGAPDGIVNVAGIIQPFDSSPTSTTRSSSASSTSTCGAPSTWSRRSCRD